MNQRIFELEEQAFEETVRVMGLTCLPEAFDDYYTEKFAELIVKECADICNKIYFDRYPDAEDFERSEEGDAIKKHFGVEE